MQINKNFENLAKNYLFIEIARKRNEFIANNPDKKVISLGIGDVTLPLAPVVIDAMHKAVDEMAKKETFKGYAPDTGYPFLKEAIQGYYAKKGVHLELNEIFISDGAKSDTGNIGDIFDNNSTCLIPDPVYPVYVDTNIMSGKKIKYAIGNKENNFLPMPDFSVDCDIIYLCSPNNPTGAVYNYEQLTEWVKYAHEKNAIILYDAAYEAFIGDTTTNTVGGDALIAPSSIYQIEASKDVAIEFCSLSKTAGFTGTRCGYTIVPNATKLNALWARRQGCKFNETPYIIQRGAEAVFTDEGLAQNRKNIAYYKNNAKIISNALKELGIWHIGGDNSPYIWLECPNNLSSWKFFDKLLNEANIVGTPGSGFGSQGEGFFRLSSFGSLEQTTEAVERLKKVFQNISV